MRCAMAPAFSAGSSMSAISTSSISAAVRTVVRRIVFAWKNDHRLAASICLVSAVV